jgi:hypothetical protein
MWKKMEAGGRKKGEANLQKGSLRYDWWVTSRLAPPNSSGPRPAVARRPCGVPPRQPL